jgi:hypothetical protein
LDTDRKLSSVVELRYVSSLFFMSAVFSKSVTTLKRLMASVVIDSIEHADVIICR